LIRTERLTRRFHDLVAVDEVSLHVAEGEVLGFLGPNGAGKSTTIRILTGFLPATSGRAEVAGFDVATDSLRVRERIGYLPENVPLPPDARVDEYLDFRARLKLVPRARRAAECDRVLQLCGLLPMRRRIAGQLSHGYRQRVGLAQALIHDPPILILDEPTSDLDPNEKAEFLEYLKQIGEDRTVMLSTHNLAEVEAACARAIIVRKGRVVADGPLDEIRAKTGKTRYVVSIQETSDAYKGKGAPPTKGQVEDALRSLPGVVDVRELPTDERLHSYAVSTDAKADDLRPEIYALCVGKGWVLLELRREVQTLENVFRNLTIGDELRNRKVGASDDEEEEEEDDEEEEDEEEDDKDEEEEDDEEEKDEEEEDDEEEKD
jgi:ABC-2 type transport system ATP-binding protein